MRVVLWLAEGTWHGCIDAAAPIIPQAADVVLLHVTPSDVAEAAEAASAGLLGRGHPERALRINQITDKSASQLLAAADARLGRQGTQLLNLRGRVDRQVIRATADGVDLLVAARDGDRSRPGPHSLGHTTRFVVDHAPCAVLLVWPGQPPSTDSITLPPHKPRPPYLARP